MKPLRITQKHIDNGQQKSMFGCALALAMADAYGGSWRVSHDRAWNGPIYDRRTQIVKLTIKAMDFKKRFDRDKTSVQPTVMEVSTGNVYP